jgi:DNA-directed RNA polymerase specialized sigma24 family protein
VLLDPVVLTWEDVKFFIFSLIKRHIRQYGGEFDELEAICKVAFAKAYNSYDGRTKFITWVGFNCKNALIDRLRECCRKSNRPKTRQISDSFGRQQLYFSRSEFVENLSEEAKILVIMGLETPPEVVLEVARKGTVTTTRIRSALKQVLGSMGWSPRKISNAFREIGAALV